MEESKSIAGHGGILRKMPWASLVEFAERLVSSIKRPVEFLRVVWRYASHTVRLAHHARTVRQTQGVRTLGVLPRLPLPVYTIWGIAETLGLTLVAREQKHTLLWLDLTEIKPHRLPAGDRKYINGRCVDINKTTIARVFEEVCGRALSVDPRDYTGLMVEKSETNGVHDGRIVDGPLASPKKNQAYQRLINNLSEDGKFVEDLRAVVAGTKLPVVYRKHRVHTRRFESSSVRSEIHQANEVFSATEQQQLIAFAERIGMEFGELDVLRDREDAQIYIVDANKTSISPPISMTYEKRFEALTLTAKAFEQEFLT